MDILDFKIDFTDLTINQSDGDFEKVNRIMNEEFHGESKWTLRSEVTITSQAGMGAMVVQFHMDRSVYIIDYYPSIGDLFYNPDIRAISMWAQEHGWKVPQPHFDLVKNSKDFWKHFYDTLIIDSDYLDKQYGKRPQLSSEKEKDEDEEDDDYE